jgi:hypothetical protein
MFAVTIIEVEEDNIVIEFGEFFGYKVGHILERWYERSYEDPELFKWFYWLLRQGSCSL